jgi:hypothetical protein
MRVIGVALVARRIWSITAIGSQLNLTWRQKADLVEFLKMELMTG